MAKTLDDHFADWEAVAFGFGYGTGEDHTVPALRAFLELCPDEGVYDYRRLEATLGPTVAWMLINVLAREDILEYGTSPRGAWLTDGGRALKAFTLSKPVDDLVALTSRDPDHTPCFPDLCQCGARPIDGPVCPNPFWPRRKAA